MDVARIGTLALELPYATGVTLIKGEGEKRGKKENSGVLEDLPQAGSCSRHVACSFLKTALRDTVFTPILEMRTLRDREVKSPVCRGVWHVKVLDER